MTKNVCVCLVPTYRFGGWKADPSRVKPADTEGIHAWVIVTFSSILTQGPRKVFFWA